MRNLKKVLSLVLCMAVMLSVMVVGAGAAFSDQSKIKNTEAVDACAALNIINGYTDGSFKPEGTITRAEACKMICVALNGGEEPTLGTSATASFTDTKGHWAEGYIESCVAQGIVAGVGGGKFNPNGNVTGTQFAKMLLIALGYNSDNQGYTGAAWEVNVNVDASSKGLYADLAGMDPSQALSRDNAAQMVWNALNAYEVEYKYNLVTENGQLTSKLVLQDKVDGNFKKITLLKDKYEADKEDAGILLSCTKVDGKDYYTITTSLKDTNQKNITYNKISADVSDLLGQEIQLLHKQTATEDTVYGVYADEDSKVVATGLLGDFQLDGTDKVKLDGTSYKIEGTTSQTTNVVYVAQQLTATKSYTDLANDAVKGTITPTTAASSIKLIDNDGNGKVDVAVLTPAQVAKVTAVSKTSVTLDYLTAGEANATIKFEDADVYTGIAKDDYVTVIDDANRSSDNDLISKLTVTSAKADATRTNEVKVSGNWYKLAKNEGNVISVTTGNTYDFIMVGNVVVNAEETAAAATNVAYISAVDTVADNLVGDSEITVKVRMYFQDDTNGEVKVSKLNGEKLKTGKTGYDLSAVLALAHKMVTYSKLSDGTYDIKAVSANNKVGMDWIVTPATTTYSKSSTSYTTTYQDQKIGKKSIADDAVVFVQTADSTKVLTGKQVKNWADEPAIAFAAGDTQILTKSSNGIDYVKFAVLYTGTAGTKVPGASNDKLYGYLVANPYQGEVDGEKKAAYDIWTGSGDVKTVYVDASNDSTGAVAGNVISYSEDGKYIDEVAIVGKIGPSAAGSTGMVAITGVNGDTIAYKSGNGTEYTYDFDKDCVFIAVNDDKTEGAEGSKDTVTKANEFVDGGNTYYIPNAYIVTDVDGSKTVVVAVIFDADDSELDVSYGAGSVTMLIQKQSHLNP
ncbi:MAG: S-layer homology domain-containing protein [Bacillota bacterium]|nr:S-layer homology domain-containing protein [Bacillota bacterium]